MSQAGQITNSSISGSVTSIVTNSGRATPSAGVINLYGTTNETTTSASGNTATIALSSTLVLPGSLSLNTNTTVSGTYDISSTDCVLAINTSSAAVTVNLPASPTLGRILYVLDSSGNANTNNITVEGNGNDITVGETAHSSVTLANQYACQVYLWNGTNWVQVSAIG